MELSTLEYKGYKARITNISKDTDITNNIVECSISLPKSTYISSMECKFNLDEKLVDVGNEVRIEILDEVGNTIYTTQGEAFTPKKVGFYTGNYNYEYQVRDSYSRLFEKVVPESITYYDLYLCNTNDKENSLLHKIAKNLGFKYEDMEFDDVIFDNGHYIRVPFIYLEENSRWMDKLQGFIESTDGILYVKNKKLIFKQRNFNFKVGQRFDRTNCISSITESLKTTDNNGIKLVYDKFKSLENQVVFNLSSKIITEPNLSEIPTMRINYITSAVNNPALTKATGYYFEEENKIDVELVEGVHYEVVSWKNTGAEVKFLNPYGNKLYIDNFEISGIPLAMFEDNEVNVMLQTVKEKSQENFIITNKNKFIQTNEQALFLCKRKFRREIANTKSYNLKTYFIRHIEIGDIFELDIQDFKSLVEVNAIDILLKPNYFTMNIQASEVLNDIQELKISKRLSGNSKEQFIDLRNIEENIENNKVEVKEVKEKIYSKLHKQEIEPIENIKEYDVWLNPKNNVFKQYLNGQWSPIQEKDLLPSIKHFNSLDKAQLDIAKVNERAGLFLLNNDEKFGSINGTLGEVSLDKQGTIRLKNVNNLLEWNVKDPKDSTKMKSKLYMGVTDVTKIPDDVYFKIGDDSNGFSLEFKDGKEGIAKVDGEEISSKFNSVESALENGNFTVTGNTVFNGDVNIVSSGSDEVVQIANGTIDFFRDGKKLSRITNIKYGTVATDSKGKGVVTFEGFQQPMLVYPTIKNVNFGKNMASMFCYAELIDAQKCQYRFYLGGTNEYHTTPVKVKTVGQEYSVNDVLMTTLHANGGKLKYFSKKPFYYINGSHHTYEAKALVVTKKPKFKLEIQRISNGNKVETLLKKEYSLTIKKHHGDFEVPEINLSHSFEIIKKYAERTKVKYKIIITILEKYFEGYDVYSQRYSHNDNSYYYRHYQYDINSGFYTLSMDKFTGFSLTTSSETSTLGGVAGDGEVNYIAMEIKEG